MRPRNVFSSKKQWYGWLYMNKKTPAKILNKQKKERERERLTVDLFFCLLWLLKKWFFSLSRSRCHKFSLVDHKGEQLEKLPGKMLFSKQALSSKAAKTQVFRWFHWLAEFFTPWCIVRRAQSKLLIIVKEMWFLRKAGSQKKVTKVGPKTRTKKIQPTAVGGYDEFFSTKKTTNFLRASWPTSPWSHDRETLTVSETPGQPPNPPPFPTNKQLIFVPTQLQH